MSGSRADGPPMETHMLIEGPIVWSGGYVIRCLECGAERGWRLSAHPGTGPGHTPADVADLTCPEGHTQHHPLIYPDVVRALFPAYRDGGLTEQKVTAALQAIGWRPHNRVTRHGTATYLPWEYLPGPDEATWPDLCWVYQGGTLPRPAPAKGTGKHALRKNAVTRGHLDLIVNLSGPHAESPRMS